MKTDLTNPVRPKPHGFSLVELLVVIVVIGILAAVTIPSFSNVFENSSQSTAKNQAQRIASVYAAGIATGAPNFKTANSVATAMNSVGSGSFGAGINSGAFFQIPGISATMDDSKPVDQQAKHYLTYSNGVLKYVPTGSNQPDPEPEPQTYDWEYTGSSFPDANSAQSALTGLQGQTPNFDFEIRTAQINSGSWWGGTSTSYQIWKRQRAAVI
jgi:prepilin-type N-terminal cleavage/methylation domain-containing protein